MNALRQMLTGRDNATLDLGRVSWVVSLLAVITAAVLNSILLRQAIDLVAFSTAIGAVVAAHGAALWAKKDTEPQP